VIWFVGEKEGSRKAMKTLCRRALRVQDWAPTQQNPQLYNGLPHGYSTFSPLSTFLWNAQQRERVRTNLFGRCFFCDWNDFLYRTL